MNYKWSKNMWTSVRRMATAMVAILGWAFVPVHPPTLLAAPSDSLTVTIKPRDIYPPAAIQDLTATPGAVGQILLQWTAPDSNNNLIVPPRAATSYQVRIATFSIDNLSGDTTAWWTLAQDVTGEPPPSTPGTVEFMLINGLATGVTHYVSIVSVDDVGLVSPIDVKSVTPGQQARAYLIGATPPTPTDLVGTALSNTSVRWTWSPIFGATYYRLTTAADVLIAQTTGTSLVETGFLTNTQITRLLRAGNSAGLSPPGAAASIYTLAVTPLNLSMVSVGITTATIQWDVGLNPTGTRFVIERSTNGVVFSTVATQTANIFADGALTPATSYYYRVAALNGNDIRTAATAFVFVLTLPAIDTLAPDQPMGLKGILDPSGSVFTLIWEPVAQNTDGSPINDLAGYNIYRRTTVTGSATKLTGLPITIHAFADVVNGQTFYYTVRAIDTSGNESIDSLIADSSPFANIIFVGPDNLSNVVMPSSVNDLLRSAHNKYGVTLTVGMSEEPIPSNTEIIRHIRLQLLRGDTKAPINDLAFAEPQSVIAVAYNVINGQVGYGRPLADSPLARAAAVSPNQLSLYWSNDVTWVKVGGTLDTNTQTIKIKSSYLGSYQLRALPLATSLSLEQANVYPRVFSPNGDGFNDKVYFVLENPNNATVTGEIFDLGGRPVATLNEKVGGIGTMLFWDGKDSTGAVVPGGVYIYKIRGEGKTFTGTVAVAR